MEADRILTRVAGSEVDRRDMARLPSVVLRAGDFVIAASSLELPRACHLERRTSPVVSKPGVHRAHGAFEAYHHLANKA